MMSLRQKIAQMLIVGFRGTTLDEAQSVTSCIARDGLGGVILFDYDLITKTQGKNLINKNQIKTLNDNLQKCAQQHSSELPLFIAIDYEGGAVDRLKRIPECPATVTPEQFAYLSESEQETMAKTMASTLKSLGFNLNFAPVVDVHMHNDAGIIGRLGRSFSTQTGEIVRVARRFVRAFADKGIVCCYKHFPGHGSAVGDTHLGFVDVTDTFELRELEPYRALLSTDNTMIMTAHVINRKLDGSSLPATLSSDILENMLREQFGFTGVIISDDLQMRAIANHFDLENALERTINAGSDMIIVANQLDEIEPITIIDMIEQLVLDNKIDVQRIDIAFQRISSLKQRYLIKSCQTA